MQDDASVMTVGWANCPLCQQRRNAKWECSLKSFPAEAGKAEREWYKVWGRRLPTEPASDNWPMA